METTDTPTTRLCDALFMLADDKWRPLVFLELAHQGEMQFGQIRRSLAGVRPKGLTKALRALEAASLVDRQVTPSVPPRVAYRLTDRAYSALPILIKLSNCLLGETEEALLS